ncbi:hypothetical protein NE865_02522 [Phthorimaea operculella]|nr:hypothetical protein NE865_02522 [Phthorimaea operculella]
MDTSFLANDVLTFLEDKLTITNEASIIQLCSTYFSVDDICKAKALPCKWLKLNVKCVPHRTGDKNCKKSLQDIMNILKGTDHQKVPIFLRATHKKLPNALDQQDVTRLLRDVKTLEIKLEEFQRKFERSGKTIVDLRAEVDLLLKSATRSAETSSPADNQNRGMRAADESYTSATSASSANSPNNRTDQHARAPAAAAPLDPPGAAAPGKIDTADKGKHRRRNNANRPPKPLAASATNNKGMAKLPLVEPTLNKPCNQVDADRYTMVQKKHRKQPRKNKCGTAPVEANLLLRAFTPRTSLYVSRLHDTTTKQDVLDYIFARHKAGAFKNSPSLGVYVEPLESRHWVGFVRGASLDSYTERLHVAGVLTAGSRVSPLPREAATTVSRVRY